MKTRQTAPPGTAGRFPAMLRFYAALRPLLLPAARPRLAALRAASGGASGGADGAPPPADDGEGDEDEEEEDDDDDDEVGEPSGDEEAPLAAAAGGGNADRGKARGRPRPRDVDDEEESTPEGYNFMAKLFDAPPGLDLAEYWNNALLSGARHTHALIAARGVRRRGARGPGAVLSARARARRHVRHVHACFRPPGRCGGAQRVRRSEP